MAGKLSPQAQMRLASVRELERRVQHVHGLVEQYAAARVNVESYAIPMRRAFAQLKMHFMGSGLDAMSQLAGSMEIASRRTMSQVTKTRILRDAVGSLKFQLELEQRSIVSEDAKTADAADEDQA
jgi:hypothetical protein